MKLFKLITLKRKLEEVFMSPFVWAGKRWAARHPLDEDYDVFFFFTIYGLGGAEKANADVVACVPEKKVIIFFTRRSKDKSSIHLFQQPHTTIKDISRWTDSKRRYWDNFFYRGVCAAYISGQKKKPVVFNGQCNFAYKLFTHLSPAIRKIELIHNSDRHFALVILPHVPFIEQRIMVADCHIRDHAKIYDEFGLPAALKSRMKKILYKFDLPATAAPKTACGDKLNVYYAGRGGPQKRLWLLMKAIERCLALNLPLRFHLAGNFEDEIPPHLRHSIRYLGLLKAGEQMAQLHQQMDVLVLTSAFEGFPLVIGEAMMHGVVPIATAVDGVPEHISNGYNGLLITDTENEEAVVIQLVEHLQYLSLHREHLAEMSKHAFNYVRETFSEERFCNSYRHLLDAE